MHEFGIAQGIVETALESARQNGATRVIAVRVRIGALAGVVDDALAFAFDALCADTPAQGARLVVEAVPVACYCRSCAREFDAPDFAYACPVCGELSSEVRRGRELQLVSVEVA